MSTIDRCLRVVVLGILAVPLLATVQRVRDLEAAFRNGLSGCTNAEAYRYIASRSSKTAQRCNPCKPGEELLAWGTARIPSADEPAA